MSKHLKCLLLLMAVAMLWSSSGLIVKSVNWNPLALASARAFVAATAIFFIARKKTRWERPGRVQWLGSILVALVALLFVSSTKLTTAANAIFLQYTAPVWVAILAPLLLGERTTRRDCFFIALTFVGMGLFFKDSMSAEGFWGIILGILCGMAFAGMAMSFRFLKDGQSFQIMVYGNLILAAAGLVFWRPPWPDARSIAIIIAAGIFQYGLSYYLLGLASEGVSSLELVLVTVLEAVLNPLWVYLVIGEKPGAWAVAGGAVVLTSVTAWSILKTRSPAAKAVDRALD